MRIEQSNQYYAQYYGIGSKNALEKCAHYEQQPVQQQANLSAIVPRKQIYSYLIPTGMNRLSVNTNDDGTTVFNDSSTTEIQALANKYGCTVTGEGILLSSNGLPVDKSTLEEFVQNEIIDNKKIEDLNNSLEKMGIMGKVSESSFARIPNNYSMFYVETPDGKNIVLMQLESGKYMVSKSPLRAQNFLDSWGIFCRDNGVDNEKKSEDALAKYFRKFMGTNVETFKGNLGDSIILQELRKNYN